jgi:hypothetical protein
MTRMWPNIIRHFTSLTVLMSGNTGKVAVFRKRQLNVLVIRGPIFEARRLMSFVWAASPLSGLAKLRPPGPGAGSLLHRLLQGWP